MNIPIRVVPFTRLARRALFGRASLEKSCYQREILCEREKEEIAPSIFLPGEIDKVTGSPVFSTKDKEIGCVLSDIAIHEPTIAFHLRNAVVLDGSIYAGRYRLQVAVPSREKITKIEYLKKAVLVSSMIGQKFFGHWLADDCVQFELAQQLNQFPLSPRLRNYVHQRFYANIFGQDWAPVESARIEDLIVLQDFAQNSLKKQRYGTLRSRLQKRFPPSGRSSLVYLKRGQAGAARIISNEQDMISRLAAVGFTVVDIESSAIDVILSALVDAKIVVSIEGSHVAHCTFSVPRNSGLIVLQPPDQFTAVHRDWSACLGVRFGFVVGERKADGYYFSPLDVLRTVDLMSNALA